jgi:uncharacterized phage-associated protein
MAKSLAVANEIILLAKAAGRPPTQMKLQKLIFFAHGWHLALADAPLVDEQFQAWKYGPVIPSVYQKFKQYGTMGITGLGLEAKRIGETGIEWIPPHLEPGAAFDAALLRKIWEVYGHFTGNQLSAMTHAPDTPWTRARQQYGDVFDIPIPDEDIKQYFKGKLDDAA